MKVFIGCASNVEIDNKYKNIAYEVADKVAKNNHTLVYGGASYSMMGECYKAFVDNNKDIIAIMAEKYKEDLVNLTLADNYIVKTSLERIERIYTVADAFIILPGGIGTIEELFSIIEENRTNSWKKLIIYNYNNFYDFIIEWLNNNVQTGFVYQEDLDNIVVVDNIDDLIANLEK